MPESIPEDIRRKVWSLYLRSKKPLSLGQIAKATGISKTSVFSIVHNTEQKDPDYALMRALVINLGKNGSDIFNYGSYLRMSNMLGQYGIDLTAAEIIIKDLLPALYKEHWSASKAISTLKKFEDSANRFGYSPAQHASYMSKLFAHENGCKRRANEWEQRLQSLIKKHTIVNENLEIFTESHGVITESARQTRESISYKIKYDDLKRQMRSDKPVDPEEMKKLNNQLFHPVTEQEVLDILESMRMNPSAYPELFQKIPSPLANGKEGNDHSTLFNGKDVSQIMIDSMAEGN